MSTDEKTSVDPPLPRVRPQYTSSSLHRNAVRIWRLLTGSLIVDAIVASSLPDSLAPQAAQPELAQLSLVVIALACCGLVHPAIVARIGRLRALQLDGRRTFKAKRPLLIAGLLISVVLVKLLPALTGSLQIGVPVLPVVIFFMAVVASHLFKTMQTDLLELTRNPTILIERWNIQSFLIVLVPLLAARALSVLGIVTALTAADPFFAYLPYGALSLLILSASKPLPYAFVGPCPRCWRSTSLAVSLAFRCCPACSPEVFSPRA